MHHSAVLLSIPGLRSQDLASMPRLSALASGNGASVPLTPSFPCVTWPVQASLLTGVGPEQHGVIANGLYHRESGDVEMWTAWNECVQSPQIWDRLHEHDESLTSAAWFPLLSKGCAADYFCIPAPHHNEDGTESMWCHTKPEDLYPELMESLGHFPLMHFWGPLANIKSTDWIVDSAVVMAQKFQPRFSALYLQHLDYAAQKFGPNSEQAQTAIGELDTAIGRLIDGYIDAGLDDVLWLAASEYVITEVNDVCYPNRVLREAECLAIREDESGGEVLVPSESVAWVMVDHQFAHVFVRDSADIERVAEMFRQHSLIERVLVGAERGEVGLDHPRSGEIVLIAKPHAWFAYYWWMDDDRAPAFARTVDIHNKPGYDPVEMFIDMSSRQTPLDATLVRGSHGYPATDASRQGVLVSSDASTLNHASPSGLRDVDVAGIVLENFGVTGE
ncbi:MAG: alkaline phosphatase family protein [Planctomycetaceae bacterium]|nr:alkaline phosphatase family protein [Planctomycetaceae bacterium]